MNAWSEKNIHDAPLGKYSNTKLFALLEKVIEKEGEMYSYGVLLPTLDFLGFSFVEGNVEKFLKSRVSADEYQKYFETFTFPAHNSFSQDQEEALLKLMSKHDSSEWRNAVLSYSPEAVQKTFPKFGKDLEKHAQKWGWVYYVYLGPAFTVSQFFDFVRLNIQKGIQPKQKLEELKLQRLEVKKRQTEFLKKLQPDSFNKMILKLAGTVVWAKPSRKDYQSKTYFHSEKLFAEIGKRLGLAVNEARSVPPAILKAGLLGNAKPDKGLAQSAFDLHVCLPNPDGSVSVFWGDDASFFDKNFVIQGKSETVSETKELKGTIACRGKVQGTARIINLPEDMKKMSDGDILVSVATTPSVVPAMKMAAAIITDEGGLTCHAAIVSRELGTPCIVGTKIATKVLKDGDLVEVDANSGVVKILKRL
jgi:phosphohistidine swiveling domain-containing protein